MTSAITHNDTNISLLVTNNYYDDRMIAHTHVFCAIIKIYCECSALLITVDNVNTFWTYIGLYIVYLIQWLK